MMNFFDVRLALIILTRLTFNLPDFAFTLAIFWHRRGVPANNDIEVDYRISNSFELMLHLTLHIVSAHCLVLGFGLDGHYGQLELRKI